MDLINKTWEIRTLDVGKEFHCPKDVKDAILKFEKRLKRVNKVPNEIERYELLQDYIKIFGRVENE